MTIYNELLANNVTSEFFRDALTPNPLRGQLLNVSGHVGMISIDNEGSFDGVCFFLIKDVTRVRWGDDYLKNLPHHALPDDKISIINALKKCTCIIDLINCLKDSLVITAISQEGSYDDVVYIGKITNIKNHLAEDQMIVIKELPSERKRLLGIEPGFMSILLSEITSLYIWDEYLIRLERN